jgi:hypothetical protein
VAGEKRPAIYNDYLSVREYILKSLASHLIKWRSGTWEKYCSINDQEVGI